MESKFSGDFLDAVALDAVADLEFVEAIDANAAFHAGAHFVDFILETAERLDDTFVNEVLPAHDPHFAARDAAMRYVATGHVAAFEKLEDLAHFGGADDGVLRVRFEQAGHGLFDLVHQLVDDRVELDLDTFAFGNFGGGAIDACMEAENN